MQLVNRNYYNLGNLSTISTFNYTSILSISSTLFAKSDFDFCFFSCAPVLSFYLYESEGSECGKDMEGGGRGLVGIKCKNVPYIHKVTYIVLYCNLLNSTVPKSTRHYNIIPYNNIYYHKVE